VAEPKFPLWAFTTLVAAIPIGFVLLALLLRRLRLVYPDTWEGLGRPTVLLSPLGKSFIAILENVAANVRLLAFPFRTQSFQLDDPATACLLWLMRINLALVWALGLWSWWVAR
jgi:hypothetical protein